MATCDRVPAERFFSEITVRLAVLGVSSVPTDPPQHVIPVVPMYSRYFHTDEKYLAGTSGQDGICSCLQVAVEVYPRSSSHPFVGRGTERSLPTVSLRLRGE